MKTAVSRLTLYVQQRGRESPLAQCFLIVSIYFDVNDKKARGGGGCCAKCLAPIVELTALW